MLSLKLLLHKITYFIRQLNSARVQKFNTILIILLISMNTNAYFQIQKILMSFYKIIDCLVICVIIIGHFVTASLRQQEREEIKHQLVYTLNDCSKQI